MASNWYLIGLHVTWLAVLAIDISYSVKISWI